MKIYFGHQSVGLDIINGMNDIIKSSPHIRLSIRRTKDPADFDQPVFGEFPIGKNEDPKSKIDEGLITKVTCVATKCRRCGVPAAATVW